MEEFRAIVSGRVQMVMYRDFAQRHAGRYGVTGFVRNCDDGSVEVVAQGERGALEKLLADLYRGPLLAKVSDVAVEWRSLARTYKEFEIMY